MYINSTFVDTKSSGFDGYSAYTKRCNNDYCFMYNNAIVYIVTWFINI